MFDSTTKKTILDVSKFVCFFNIIIFAIIFIFVDDPFPMILGVLFGSLTTLLMFVELAMTLEKSLKMKASTASAYTMGKYYIRFAIYGIVIFVSIKASYINVVGTVIGLLSVKTVIYIINILLKKSKGKEE